MFEKTISLPEDHKGRSGTRSACRGVVIDENGLIPLVLDSYMGYYKLPGGGIEGDEDKISAFRREILEEAGCEITDIQEVGKVIEKNSKREQTNYCYIGKITKKGEKHFTEKEIQRGYKLIRVEINEAYKLITNEQPKFESGQSMKERESYILRETIKLIK